MILCGITVSFRLSCISCIFHILYFFSLFVFFVLAVSFLLFCCFIVASSVGLCLSSGCVVECRICNRDVAGSNLGMARHGLLHTKVYSAFHPSGVGKWVPAAAGKAKAGMAHPDCGWTCGCAGKTVKSLENTCHTWAPAVLIHYEEALCQVYAPLPFTFYVRIARRWTCFSGRAATTRLRRWPARRATGTCRCWRLRRWRATTPSTGAESSPCWRASAPTSTLWRCSSSTSSATSAGNASCCSTTPKDTATWWVNRQTDVL